MPYISNIIEAYMKDVTYMYMSNRNSLASITWAKVLYTYEKDDDDADTFQ